MSETATQPELIRIYYRYLDNESTADFVATVAHRYSLATLERLAVYSQRVGRRAAVMALGFLADYPVNRTLGPALRDEDRGVRMLAESGVRQLWTRVGTCEQRRQLQQILQLNREERFGKSVRVATLFINKSHWIAEAWHQRGVAKLQRQWYEDAVGDFREAITRNAFHFPAAVGMGQCYLALDKPFSALQCFQDALRIYPDLEQVRAQVNYLRRVLEEP